MGLPIVWGTKSNTYPVGIRGNFCLGCFQLRKGAVLANEESSHVYFVALGWSEKSRFWECEVCHYKMAEEPDGDLLTVTESEALTGTKAFERTSTPGEKAGLAALREKAGQLSDEERKNMTLDTFLKHVQQRMEIAELDVGGGSGILLFVFIMAALATGIYGGLAAGIVLIVVLVMLLLYIHQSSIHSQVGTPTEKDLGRFLKETGLTWKDLEERLEYGTGISRKVRRHLKKERYDPYRDGVA